MQTFIPETSYHDTARLLDRQRLGKQRVECWQILRALTGETKGWANHPASLMWAGHEAALAMYGVAMCDEWISRGYQDSMRDRLLAYTQGSAELPSWWGGPVHETHRALLIRKRPEHYESMWPGTDPELPLIWPLSLRG